VGTHMVPKRKAFLEKGNLVGGNFEKEAERAYREKTFKSIGKAVTYQGNIWLGGREKQKK